MSGGPHRLPRRLHLVTDAETLRQPSFRDRSRRVLEAYGAAVALHVRGHGLHGAALYERVREAVIDARATGAKVVVNDRVDAALAAGADGVQVGRRSLPVAEARRLLGPEALVGYSAHEAEGARRAVEDGADFVLIGTIHPSASHPGAAAAGPELVRLTAEAVDAPVIAIGGIDPALVAELLNAGAYGVASLGGVWRANDPVEAAGRYLAALEGEGQ